MKWLTKLLAPRREMLEEELRVETREYMRDVLTLMLGDEVSVERVRESDTFDLWQSRRYYQTMGTKMLKEVIYKATAHIRREMTADMENRIGANVAAHVKGEAFIDDVVDRINRKQVGS